MESTKSAVREFVLFIVLALAIVVPFRIFVAQPFIVHGESMFPTFHEGEYLIVDQLSYRFGDPSRGDVVVFEAPTDNTQFYIKRIIGLPGETVSVSGEQVIIENAEGSFVLEDGAPQPDLPQANVRRVLGAGEYFVMGDNRDHSYDSREWGALKERKIMGRAAFRLLPFSRAGTNPGAVRAAE